MVPLRDGVEQGDDSMTYTHLGWFEHKDGRWCGYLAVAPSSTAYEPDKVYATVEGRTREQLLKRMAKEAHFARQMLGTALHWHQERVRRGEI